MKTKLLLVFTFLAFQSLFAKTLVDPIAPSLDPMQYCDPNGDGFGTFDLDSQTSIIVAAQSGNPSDYAVTYHETPDDALDGIAPVASPYSNITAWSQIVYYRVTHISTNAFTTGFVKLNVNPRPYISNATDLSQCDYNGNGVEIFDFTPLIPQILGVMNPATATVTFYTTLASAEVGVNPIAPINAFAGADGQTIYARLTHNVTGCYDVVSFQLHVEPIPSSMQPNYPEYALCDVNSELGYETFDLGSRINSILMGQTGVDVAFYPTLADAQNDTYLIGTSFYMNEVQYVQTLGVKLSNQATGCYTISTMDIRVVPLPQLIAPSAPYAVCDDNQDGTSVFDLTSLIPDLLAGQNYTVTFHETLMDAEVNGTTIPDPSFYININPFSQTIYVRGADNITGCSSIVAVQLNVNPAPIIPTLSDIQICDADSNPQSATTLINLTQQSPEILAQQPLPASSYIVTYYTSQSDAEAGTGTIIPATNYFGVDGEAIWYRVELSATGCYAVGSFYLVINTPLALITPTPLKVCDSDANPNDQQTMFDLTVKDTEIAQATGHVVTYYPSFADAQAGINPITNPTIYVNTIPAVQTVGVTVTSPDGCVSITTLEIRVLAIPTPNFNPPALVPQCDVNNPGDMLEVFDLTVNENYIRNGSPGLTLHYFTTMAEAEASLNEIITPTAAIVGGNVWIRVESGNADYQGNSCYVLVEQPLRVNALPTVIQPLPPYKICDNNADGIAQFDLTNPLLAQMILGSSQLPSGFTISFHLTQANAVSGIAPLPSIYTNVTPNSQIVYIRVVKNNTGCVNATGLLTLAVDRFATASGPQIYSSCDNYANPYDGVVTLDLTQFESAILNGQNPAVYLLRYYTSQSDAINGVNALTPAQQIAYVTDPDIDTVWAKVVNTNNSIQPFCYALTTIDISVDRYPNPIINTVSGVNSICVDYISGAVTRSLTLNSGIANPSAYTFEWYEAGSPSIVIGTSPTYTVDTPSNGATRNYNVRVRANGALGCQRSSSLFSVIQSGSAVIPTGTNGYTITNLSGVHSITVAISGYGFYEYSLDSGPRQNSPIFENVSLGNHTISVWDTEGGTIYSCDSLTISDVQIAASQVSAPTGVNSQSFVPGATLASIVVNGTNIQWYASANTKNNLTTLSAPLPLSTVLVDGVTYYATQTVGGIESTAYLPVTVHVSLGIDDNEILPIQYAPNPLKNSLNLQSAVILKSITVYTMLGQKVFEQEYNDTEVTIDLSKLATGNYVLQAQGETGQKTIRIIKE
ncbi:MAG: T9SS type A sorting domain-containing protein [Flavobacterium sp. JAD_PAG50586_2]|nr:MAG: T9SS type A sorting domain-containing protein [Flavobacterium sp. JAD_PAG50586_2]